MNGEHLESIKAAEQALARIELELREILPRLGWGDRVVQDTLDEIQKRRVDISAVLYLINNYTCKEGYVNQYVEAHLFFKEQTQKLGIAFPDSWEISQEYIRYFHQGGKLSFEEWRLETCRMAKVSLADAEASNPVSR
jgi:hypothetical protein